MAWALLQMNYLCSGITSIMEYHLYRPTGIPESRFYGIGSYIKARKCQNTKKYLAKNLDITSLKYYLSKIYDENMIIINS